MKQKQQNSSPTLGPQKHNYNSHPIQLQTSVPHLGYSSQLKLRTFTIYFPSGFQLTLNIPEQITVNELTQVVCSYRAIHLHHGMRLQGKVVNPLCLSSLAFSIPADLFLTDLACLDRQMSLFPASQYKIQYSISDLSTNINSTGIINKYQIIGAIYCSQALQQDKKQKLYILRNRNDCRLYTATKIRKNQLTFQQLQHLIQVRNYFMKATKNRSTKFTQLHECVQIKNSVLIISKAYPFNIDQIKIDSRYLMDVILSQIAKILHIMERDGVLLQQSDHSVIQYDYQLDKSKIGKHCIFKLSDFYLDYSLNVRFTKLTGLKLNRRQIKSKDLKQQMNKRNKQSIMFNDQENSKNECVENRQKSKTQQLDSGRQVQYYENIQIKQNNDPNVDIHQPNNIKLRNRNNNSMFSFKQYTEYVQPNQQEQKLQKGQRLIQRFNQADVRIPPLKQCYKQREDTYKQKICSSINTSNFSLYLSNLLQWLLKNCSPNIKQYYLPLLLWLQQGRIKNYIQFLKYSEIFPFYPCDKYPAKQQLRDGSGAQLKNISSYGEYEEKVLRVISGIIKQYKQPTLHALTEQQHRQLHQAYQPRTPIFHLSPPKANISPPPKQFHINLSKISNKNNDNKTNNNGYSSYRHIQSSQQSILGNVSTIKKKKRDLHGLRNKDRDRSVSKVLEGHSLEARRDAVNYPSLNRLQNRNTNHNKTNKTQGKTKIVAQINKININMKAAKKSQPYKKTISEQKTNKIKKNHFNQKLRYIMKDNILQVIQNQQFFDHNFQKLNKGKKLQIKVFKNKKKIKYSDKSKCKIKSKSHSRKVSQFKIEQ